ncbi:MAG: hypothetical protein FWH32_01720 [Clostridiales bacterium]|nr:hypothetical protein [Clostridiales bacterium]
MATSSIFNNIEIKDVDAAVCLVKALEAAEQAKGTSNPPSVEYKELRGDEIKDFIRGTKLSAIL